MKAWTRKRAGALCLLALCLGGSPGAADGRNTGEDEKMRKPPPGPEIVATLPPDGGPEFNRLVFQQSPYLLQHARNPVDWYPWGEEALAKAAAEDKPVFLSVGYSTCHWCHVMEHESFEDSTVAAILAEHYVAIKVDREERPDIDAIYMNATQILAGRGGWPNSVWLTPDGRPWFAGTYFPREDQAGRPGFRSILQNLAEVWRTRRDEVEGQANQLADAVARYRQLEGGSGDPDAFLVERALDELKKSFDAERGGFGTAPKFPPHQSLALIQGELGRGREDAELERILDLTLEAMALGGIHDHIGGGFHRYSTDSRWFLPHFEKMLYDNAQLLPVYAEAWRRTGRRDFAAAARGIAGWVLRELRDEEGGFHSAYDADSEGEEGLFYLWTEAELREVLGDEEGALFARAYGVEDGGNYHEEATDHRPGTSILYLPRPLAELAEDESLPLAELEARLDADRERLLERRAGRVWPLRDDKVLAAWNGLMIAGLARAGEIMDEPAWTRAAAEAADFVLAEMRADGRLLRSYRARRAGLAAYLDDYAFLADGLLALHAVGGDPVRLEQARALADTLLVRYWDDGEGGFHFTADDHEELLVRSKDPFDAALPSGNGVATRVLLRLAELTGEGIYRERARDCLEAFTPAMERAPRGTMSLLQALAESLDSDDAAVGLPPAAGADGDPDAHLRHFPVTCEAYLDCGRLAPGEELQLALRLVVDEGWHVNSQQPGSAYLVPTSLAVGEGVELLDQSYPVGTMKGFGFSEERISVYAGEVWLRARLRVPAGTPAGPLAFGLELRTQACDDSRCLAPERHRLVLKVAVDPAAGGGAARHPGLFR